MKPSICATWKMAWWWRTPCALGRLKHSCVNAEKPSWLALVDGTQSGDFLIDLWNTGGRYQAEELAKMVDLGELSFDWLAEECLANL